MYHYFLYRRLVPLLPTTPHGRLLPLPPNSNRLGNAHFAGITTETTPVNECCVMYEMLVVATCLSCSLRVPRCLVVDMWEPGIREHPIFLHDTLAPTSFCMGISMSYRNRNVVVAPFPLSLSWHPFRLKLCVVYVIRIVITTFKVFKIVVCINC